MADADTITHFLHQIALSGCEWGVFIDYSHLGIYSFV